VMNPRSGGRGSCGSSQSGSIQRSDLTDVFENMFGSVDLALPAAVLRLELSPKAAPFLFPLRFLFGFSFLA
jgi:hypothetical protein